MLACNVHLQCPCMQYTIIEAVWSVRQYSTAVISPCMYASAHASTYLNLPDSLPSHGPLTRRTHLCFSDSQFEHARFPACILAVPGPRSVVNKRVQAALR